MFHENDDEEDKTRRGRTRLFYLGLILVAALVLSSWLASSYYLQLTYGGSAVNRRNLANQIPVNVLFNYGNGTSNWYNTTTYPGRDFYNITLSLTDSRVESTYYSLYNEHLVQAINGVGISGNHYWQLWIYCDGKKAWLYSDWGADSLKVMADNSVEVNTQTGHFILQSDSFAWSYQDHVLPPVMGAVQTDTCSS